MACFRYINVNTLHLGKDGVGDYDDDDDYGDDKARVVVQAVYRQSLNTDARLRSPVFQRHWRYTKWYCDCSSPSTSVFLCH